MTRTEHHEARGSVNQKNAGGVKRSFDFSVIEVLEILLKCDFFWPNFYNINISSSFLVPA